MTGTYLDAHVHFWDPELLDYPWLDGEPDINRRLLPADLDAGPALEGVVFVEADRLPEQSGAEVAWVQQLARAGAPILGIVAHVPLEQGASVARAIEALRRQPLVVGVRRLIQDERPGFATHPAFVDGVRALAAHDLVMDLCVRDHQLAEVTELARRCPDVTFVLDHLGKPAVARDGFSGWAVDLATLARLPNVSCKLSGLTSQADARTQSVVDLLPYLRHAIDRFGPDRCMFGSNWPVSSTSTSYAGWLATVLDAVADLHPTEQDRVMGGTVRAVYRLGRITLGLAEGNPC